MESRIINNYVVYEDGTVISKNGIEIKWYENGRYVGCDSNANAKLTNEDVHLICKILESNEYKSISSLSREIGVARGTLSQIKNHRQWVDISKHYNF